MNLSLDDYRRVLKWAGWKNMALRDLASTLWRWQACEINERLIEVTTEPLLLLDHSVLEKVREMLFSNRSRFEYELHSLWQERSKLEGRGSFGSLFIVFSQPGDAVRAAIAAGIVS